MKELDLLKKNWQKNDNSFVQVSENEIYKMIHKKSSSIVKWILIVSILEFFILNGIALVFSSKDYDAFIIANPFVRTLDIFNYVVLIFFIFMFYKNYKSISTLKSAKELIKQILKTRKVVTYYIIWNMIFGGLLGAYSAIQGFNKGYNEGIKSKSKVEILDSTNVLIYIIVAIIIMVVIWGFYKLIYGTFLSRLSKNYEELKKIDL